MAEGRIVKLRKNYKRNRILNLIRYHENVSRFYIKKKTGYSMTTVLNTVQNLLDNNLIFERQYKEKKDVGRKPTWLYINPSGGYFIGLEFNAESMFCVILDFAGSIIYSNKTSVKRDFTINQILLMIEESIQKAIDSIKGKKGKIFGIGIGVPGYIDKESGTGIYYAHLSNWGNVKIKDYLERIFRVKVTIDNNINAMALAYKWLWYEGDCESFLFVSIRTGVRMGCILNNKLYRGKNGTAGEIGHMKVENSSRLCSCGKKGCLDTEVSTLAIENKILEGIRIGKFKEIYKMIDGDTDKINMKVFIESAKKGHKDSILLMKEIAQHLAAVLSSVITVLNPSMVVISGEIIKTGDKFINTLKKAISEKAASINVEDLSIRLCSFDERIGAIGGASLVIQEKFEVMDSPV